MSQPDKSPFQKAVSEMPDGALVVFDPKFDEVFPVLDGYNHKSPNNTIVQWAKWACAEIERVGAAENGIGFEACINHLRAYIKCTVRINDGGLIYQHRLRAFGSAESLKAVGVHTLKAISDKSKGPKSAWNGVYLLVDKVIILVPEDGITGLIQRNAAKHKLALSQAAESAAKLIDELKSKVASGEAGSREALAKAQSELGELNAARTRITTLSERITTLETVVREKSDGYMAVKESLEKLEVEASGLRSAKAKYDELVEKDRLAEAAKDTGVSETPVEPVTNQALTDALAEVERLGRANQSRAERILSLETLTDNQKASILRLELEVAKYANPGRSPSDADKDALDVEATSAIATLRISMGSIYASAKDLIDSAVSYAKLTTVAATYWVTAALKGFNSVDIPSLSDWNALHLRLRSVVLDKQSDSNSTGYWSKVRGSFKWVWAKVTAGAKAARSTFARAEDKLMNWLMDTIQNIFERDITKGGALSYAGRIWGNAALVAATPYLYLRRKTPWLIPIGAFASLLAAPLTVVGSAITILGDGLLKAFTSSKTWSARLRDHFRKRAGDPRAQSCDAAKDPERRTESNGWKQGPRGWHPTKPFRRGLGRAPSSTRGRSLSTKPVGARSTSVRSDYSI